MADRVRTILIGLLGYTAAFWLGLVGISAAGVVVILSAARRGRPLSTLPLLFAPFLVMALLYEGWLLGLPGATILIVAGLGLVGTVINGLQLRFMQRHVETIKALKAQRDSLDGDGHA